METVDLKAKDVLKAWREHQAEMARREAVGRVLEGIQEPAQAARVMEQAAEAAQLDLDRIEAQKRDAEGDVAQAKAQAEEIVEQAHEKASVILTDATNKDIEARDILTDAEVKATEIIANANGEAGTIITRAKAEADNIKRDVEEAKLRLIEIEVDTGNANNELADLKSEIAALKARFG